MKFVFAFTILLSHLCLADVQPGDVVYYQTGERLQSHIKVNGFFEELAQMRVSKRIGKKVLLVDSFGSKTPGQGIWVDVDEVKGGTAVPGKGSITFARPHYQDGAFTTHEVIAKRTTPKGVTYVIKRPDGKMYSLPQSEINFRNRMATIRPRSKTATVIAVSFVALTAAALPTFGQETKTKDIDMIDVEVGQ